MKKLNNSRGSVLLVAISILYIMIVLSMSFALANINEVNYARRFYHSTAAFWLAEAGINMYMNNPFMLDDSISKDIPYGNGMIHLTRDDSKPIFRFVTATGTYGGLQKKIQITYPANIPEVYKNVLTTQGDILIDGGKTSVVINGQTVISGEVNGTGAHAEVLFEDLQQGVDPNLTSLWYPNSGGFSSFENFVVNNRDMIVNYSNDEVLYIKAADTYTITPEAINGKKIIYVEGDEDSGNVVINSNGILKEHQNLTVISTGTVTFNQSGDQAPNSQLNIIAWGGYNETVSAPSRHRGLIYTHGVAMFDKIYDTSVNNGSVIADSGIVFRDIWSTKIFNYADTTVDGLYPSGFERMAGGSITGVALKPNSWKEIHD